MEESGVSVCYRRFRSSRGQENRDPGSHVRALRCGANLSSRASSRFSSSLIRRGENSFVFHWFADGSSKLMNFTLFDS